MTTNITTLESSFLGQTRTLVNEHSAASPRSVIEPTRVNTVTQAEIKKPQFTVVMSVKEEQNMAA